MARAQWAYESSGTNAELRGLSFANARTVWASGTRGTFLRSTDGGRSWVADTVSGMTALDFRSIHSLAPSAAVMASAGEAEKGLAKIAATTNAGRTWATAFSSDTKGIFLDAIAFWSSRSGIALSDPVGGRFMILRSDDAGRSWTPLPAERLPAVIDGEAAFAASGSSIVLRGKSQIWIGTGGGGRGRVMHSPDGGRTWHVVDTPVHAQGGAAGIFAIAFHDDKRGVAVGGDYTKPRLAATSVALTRDGGRSWTAAKTPPAAYLSGVTYAGSPRRLVAVGLAGTFVSRDGGESWTQTDTVAMNAVRASGNVVIAVGPRGRIARMDMGKP